jgi:tetratricopeptide (TPR) repeat protein
MKEIRAFVGHSFLKADEQLVSIFLNYFDSLVKSHQSFSWQNAQNAEPKVLAQKVMELVADKNTFIGICTRNERVISSDALQTRTPLFRAPVLQADSNSFLWKTSDWIIQEIGMAIGRGMDVVLLLEDGVRKPGGLQGDLEYMSFSRAAPEQSFTKILEMLGSLSPKLPGLSAVAADVPPEATQDQPGHNEEYEEPQASWTRDQYEVAIFAAIGSDNAALIKTIDEAYRRTDDSSANDNSVTWQAWIELTKLTFGRGGQLQRLQSLAKSNPQSENTLLYLARAYSIFDQHHQSAEAYLAAMAAATTAQRKAKLARDAARQFYKGKERIRAEGALDILREMSLETVSVETILTKALRDTAELDKDDDFGIAISEHLMELTPDDHDARFALAFKQGEAGNEGLSLLHYLKIPYGARNGLTWNNVGATYEQLLLPAKAVNAYKQSSEMGETLAMSNLGNRFLNAGFLELAKEQCDKALKISDPHKNIGTLLSTLAGLPEAETDREAELLSAVTTQQRYLQTLGRAATLKIPSEFGDTWQGPECIFKFERHDDQVRLFAEYERDVNLLGGILYQAIGTAPAASPRPKERITITYTGRIRGRAIIGTVKRDRKGASLLEAAGSDPKIYMILSDDGSELSVLERPNTTSPRLYVLTRVLLLSDFVKSKPE